MRERISLNGTWKLKGTASYVPLRDKSMETGKPLEGVTGWMDAQVPGGVARALFKAGYIEHPYVDMNSLKCEWIENRWWIYRRVFDRRPLGEGQRVFLHFEGVDYACVVYLNGDVLGEHEGMYEDFSFDITQQYRAQEHFVLDVLILHAPDEMGQIGRTSQTFTQKSRFGYKWDFSTRLVNLGIWQDVSLIVEDEAALNDLYVHTDVDEDGTGLIYVQGNVTMHAPVSLRVEADCSLDGVSLCHGTLSCRNQAFEGCLAVKEPQLWYPNGLGGQPLYQVTLTLYGNGVPLDQRRLRQGIRRLEMAQNEDAPAGALPYTLVVNGKRVYMKGVNVTPMDHIYGDIPPEQVAYQLRQAADMHVNIVRVWGGGVIETECFYDWCDRLGLMVWQEFIQSSSGIDNIPSERPEFLKLLAKTAVHAVKTKRNHTSLVLWSGGNELMDEQRKPQTLANKNLAMLETLTHALDPYRMFVPTSPSGPEAHIASQPGKSHDVHGWWQYQGNGRQYSYFGDTDSLLHSEFGCDGMSSMQTVVRALSRPPQRPERMRENDLWRFHGDWWCTYDREESMFGHVEDIQRYIRLSQWMQAEGLRFILEANQRRKWHNSGSIIWQLSEPWPNLSCTSLVDYYGHAKQAYFWARKAFSPLHITLNYRRLDYAPGAVFSEELVILSDAGVAGEAAITCQVLGLDGACYLEQRFTVALQPSGRTAAGRLTFPMPHTREGMAMVRLRAEAGTASSVNEYYFADHDQQPYAAAATLHGAQITAAMERLLENGAVIRVRNTGTAPVLHAYLEDALDQWNLRPDDNFHTLLPGESWLVTVLWSKRFRIGFDEFDASGSDAPALTVYGIGLDSGVSVQGKESAL